MMLDGQSAHGGADYDLVIVGAGAAGLNALFSAAQYLGPDARVALIDRRDDCGGMWRDTYDYVRLHQPHRMFTAGNIPWQLDRPPEYLATRSEVVDHLRHCLDTLAARVALEPVFGHRFDGAEEDAEGVTVRSSAVSDGTPRVLRARRLIVATGYDVPVLPPLPYASTAITCTAPKHLFDAGTPTDPPVYVVGGGKTAMDTCHALITRFPGRRIILVAGAGTAFTRRELIAPTGLRRYWAGTPSANIFIELSQAFDGTNEAEVIRRYQNHFETSLNDAAQRNFFGVLSQEELQVIRAGLAEVIYDYCEDVVDGADGPEMQMRSGATRVVETGAMFVNCTGHIARDTTMPAAPLISGGKRILTISPRAAVHFLSTVSAYFMTHLFYRDKLPLDGLYTVDFIALRGENIQALRMAAVSVSFITQSMMFRALPMQAIQDCGLDINGWFPKYRMLPVLLKLKRHGPAYVAHAQASLDQMSARFKARIGPVGT